MGVASHQAYQSTKPSLIYINKHLFLIWKYMQISPVPSLYVPNWPTKGFITNSAITIIIIAIILHLAAIIAANTMVPIRQRSSKWRRIRTSHSTYFKPILKFCERPSTSQRLKNEILTSDLDATSVQRLFYVVNQKRRPENFHMGR